MGLVINAGQMAPGSSPGPGFLAPGPGAPAPFDLAFRGLQDLRDRARAKLRHQLDFDPSMLIDGARPRLTEVNGGHVSSLTAAELATPHFDGRTRSPDATFVSGEFAQDCESLEESAMLTALQEGWTLRLEHEDRCHPALGRLAATIESAFGHPCHTEVSVTYTMGRAAQPRRGEAPRLSFIIEGAVHAIVGRVDPRPSTTTHIEMMGGTDVSAGQCLLVPVGWEVLPLVTRSPTCWVDVRIDHSGGGLGGCLIPPRSPSWANCGLPTGRVGAARSSQSAAWDSCVSGGLAYRSLGPDRWAIIAGARTIIADDTHAAGVVRLIFGEPTGAEVSAQDGLLHSEGLEETARLLADAGLIEPGSEP